MGIDLCKTEGSNARPFNIIKCIINENILFTPISNIYYIMLTKPAYNLFISIFINSNLFWKVNI